VIEVEYARIALTAIDATEVAYEPGEFATYRLTAPELGRSYLG
jgi:hypothetical protein